MEKKLLNRKILRVPVNYRDLFRFWVEFTKPFHGLTDSEAAILASFLYHRQELSKVIKDNNILDSTLMGDEMRKQVRGDCGVSLTHFHVIMGKLRKKGVLSDGKITRKLIPDIIEDGQPIGLTFIFDIKDEETDLQGDS